MPRFETRITIDAPQESVWNILANVCEWPAWAPTVKRVQPMDARHLDVGYRFRVFQPKLRPAVWRVTAVTPERDFTWVMASPGVRTTAIHRVLRRTSESCEVMLGVSMEGLGSPFAWLIAGRLTRDYVTRAAASLKAAAEASFAMSASPQAQ